LGPLPEKQLRGDGRDTRNTGIPVFRPLSVGCLELVIADNIPKKYFELINRKEPPRTGMLSMPKG
jgi:hypothetical protein